LADEGFLGAVSGGLNVFSTRIVHERDILSVQRLPQVTWNLFDTINLYEAGVRRNGETYFNLFPQAIPKPIAEFIGFERPLAEPRILARYVRHGGAIYPVAEAYWNFGIWGIASLGLVMAVLITWLERLFRRLPIIYTYIYFGGIMLFPGSFFAGTQALARVFEAMLLLCLATHVLLHRLYSYSNKPHRKAPSMRDKI
jgi:hypothetical protein